MPLRMRDSRPHAKTKLPFLGSTVCSAVCEKIARPQRGIPVGSADRSRRGSRQSGRPIVFHVSLSRKPIAQNSLFRNVLSGTRQPRRPWRRSIPSGGASLAAFIPTQRHWIGRSIIPGRRGLSNRRGDGPCPQPMWSARPKASSSPPQDQ